MKKIAIHAFLFAFVVGNAYSQEMTFTIEKALDLVYANNPVIKQAEEAVNASNARFKGKKSGYLPSLSIEGTYAHLDPDPFIDFPGFGLIQFFPADNYDAHASLTQTIWDFGKTSSSVGVANYSYQGVRKNLEIIKTNMAFQTVQVFYSVLLLKQSVTVQQQQIDSLIESLDLTKKKVESGSATHFDELTTQVKLAEAESKKIDIENMLAKQEITLGRIMGLSGSASFDITGEFSAATVDLDENALIAAGLQNRTELKLAADSEKAAQSQLSAAKADNYPSILADFSFGYKNGYLPALEEIKQNTVVGAQLAFPLFNGLKTYNQIKESKANYEAARDRERDTRDMIVAEVKQGVSEAKASMEKIKLSELEVQLAQEALGQAKVRYESGVITNLDLLNAETSLAEANLLRLQALYNYKLARVGLNKSVGTGLLEESK